MHEDSNQGRYTPLSVNGQSREPGCDGGLPPLVAAAVPDVAGIWSAAAPVPAPAAAAAAAAEAAAAAAAAGEEARRPRLPPSAEGEHALRASAACLRPLPEVEGSEVPRALHCSNVMLSDIVRSSTATAQQPTHQRPFTTCAQGSVETRMLAELCCQKRHAEQAPQHRCRKKPCSPGGDSGGIVRQADTPGESTLAASPSSSAAGIAAAPSCGGRACCAS